MSIIETNFMKLDINSKDLQDLIMTQLDSMKNMNNNLKVYVKVIQN
jgi:hypothetical protein